MSGSANHHSEECKIMVVIRQIQATEAAELRAIRLRALAESPDAFGSTLAETQARSMQEWNERVARDAVGEKGVLFVAEDAGRWIGLVGGFLEEAEGSSRAQLISM